ncbi:hypothetical protein G9C98_002760 [Cotesia typhae]|uniref:Uncharacterized protein n=1 Tax=Cotesia typhae TaxID=2053667 RepID=A0A8J5R7P9_9HYME|nr:hypothetical protein G9C98_002760 [Cotesia typhae]
MNNTSTINKNTNENETENDNNYKQQTPQRPGINKPTPAVAFCSFLASNGALQPIGAVAIVSDPVSTSTIVDIQHRSHNSICAVHHRLLLSTRNLSLILDAAENLSSFLASHPLRIHAIIMSDAMQTDPVFLSRSRSSFCVSLIGELAPGEHTPVVSAQP